MGIDSSVLPDGSTDIDFALSLAQQIVYAPMVDASSLIYDLAVYNLAGSNLVEFANDLTARFNAYISGLNLTIIGAVTGTPTIGQLVTGGGVAPETFLVGGSGLAWTVGLSQNVGSSISLVAMTSAQTYFADLRKQFDMNGFTPGVIASTSDESTSESLLNPDFMKQLTMADLQYIKNPWGRAYMAYAQRIGTVWGIS